MQHENNSASKGALHSPKSLLLEKLKEEDLSTRLLALVRLCSFEPAEEALEILHQSNVLCSSDVETRNTAYFVLGKVGNINCVNNLLEAMEGDCDPSVRASATNGISFVFSKLKEEKFEKLQHQLVKVVSRLEKMVLNQDEHDIVRYCGIMTLQSLNSQSAVSCCLNILDESNPSDLLVRSAITTIMQADFPPPEAVLVILKYMNSSNELVRQNVARALAKWPDNMQAREALRKIRDEDTSPIVAASARQSLVSILETSFYYTRTEQKPQEPIRSKMHYRDIMEIFKGNDRRKKMMAMVELEKDLTVPAHLVYELITPLLKDKYIEVRSLACNVLGYISQQERIGSTEHVIVETANELSKVLGDPSEDYAVRAAAAGGLGFLEHVSVLDNLAEALKEDESWLVRFSSAVSLGNLKDSRACPILVEALENEDCFKPEPVNSEIHMMQQAIISALGEIGCECAEKQVLHFVGASEPAIRQRVAECLGSMKATKNVIDALSFLSKDANENVAMAASRSLLGLKRENDNFVLSKYIQLHPFLVKNKHILELGAGVGLPGLVCASLGAKQVTLTDKEDNVKALTLLNNNVELNGLQSSCVVFPIDWGNIYNCDESPLLDLQVILGADVFYDTKQFEPLLMTISSIFHYYPDAVFYTLYQNRSNKRSIGWLLDAWQLKAEEISLETTCTEDRNESFHLFKIGRLLVLPQSSLLLIKVII
eukprot:jgi/Galph1/1746/GphlegSOOS_G424.1